MLSRKLIAKLLPIIIARVMNALHRHSSVQPVLRRVPVRVRGFSSYRR